MDRMPNGPLSEARDPDLIEQAKPGHGVPSQDPDPAAQQPIAPELAHREEKSVYVGGGIVAGAAAGAAVGSAVGGPIGTVVGGTVGAVAGAVGGVAAGEAATGSTNSDNGDPVEGRKDA
ncbi:MAG: bacteriocin [Burkholderiaceae bacterium]